MSRAVGPLERKGGRVNRIKGSDCAMEHPDFELTIVVPPTLSCDPTRSTRS